MPLTLLSLLSLLFLLSLLALPLLFNIKCYSGTLDEVAFSQLSHKSQKEQHTYCNRHLYFWSFSGQLKIPRSFSVLSLHRLTSVLQCPESPVSSFTVVVQSRMNRDWSDVILCPTASSSNKTALGCKLLEVYSGRGTVYSFKCTVYTIYYEVKGVH